MREACRERSRRYRRNHKDRVREANQRWWANNPDKVAVRNRKRSERYHANKKPMPEKDPSPPLPPCDCGVCLACGGWAATWKPDWHARLKAWSTQGPDSAELEDVPMDILESEADTMSTASTSEIDSDLRDRLETVLADESTIWRRDLPPPRRVARLGLRRCPPCRTEIGRMTPCRRF